MRVPAVVGCGVQGHRQASVPEVRRATGRPAPTMSPSSRSHSASTPGAAATTACSSRLVRTVPMRAPCATLDPRPALGAGEHALGRGDDDAHLGSVLALAVLGAAEHQGARLVQVVRGLDRDQVGTLELALGDPGQHTAGCELDRGGDAEVGACGEAQVPAHRQGHLPDEAGDQIGCRCRRRRRRRWTAGSGGGRRRPGCRPSHAAPSRPAPCRCVWKAPATASGRTRAPAGALSAKAASVLGRTRRRRSARRRCGWRRSVRRPRWRRRPRRRHRPGPPTCRSG